MRKKLRTKFLGAAQYFLLRGQDRQGALATGKRWCALDLGHGYA
ncbi:hypothetical protein [Marivita hallyeonensis]|uniref:Uncharacterized protein n=1 Tax=Marivita hallyeonensis TaxID=996342 RepID=A0A1M5M0M3_9RHOB|nr:hypothetical protein [Marivita hallyeonensis]SHG70798.1 hypothetical protein SAMN05443551_0351 [Marivita hallyeonensis]